MTDAEMSPDEAPGFLFESRGESFHPTALAGSPWGPEFIHGGATAALLTRAVEPAGGGSEFHVARITMDLFRPVPMSPLTMSAEALRDGRRLRVVEATLCAADGPVAVARALLLRRSEMALRAESRPFDLPHPDQLRDSTHESGARRTHMPPGVHTCVEKRVGSGFDGSGHGQAWFRLPVGIVAGESVTPLMRLGLCSDFGNGLAQIEAEAGVGYINADITLYIERVPVGDWIGLDARSHIMDGGMRMVNTELYDLEGRVGRVDQATLANRRWQKT